MCPTCPTVHCSASPQPKKLMECTSPLRGFSPPLKAAFAGAKLEVVFEDEISLSSSSSASDDLTAKDNDDDDDEGARTAHDSCIAPSAYSPARFLSAFTTWFSETLDTWVDSNVYMLQVRSTNN